MTSTYITLARTVYVHHQLQGGPVFSSGHMAALESSWCWISKKEGRTGPGLALQCVPRTAIVIPLSLFGCNPFDNRSHKMIVHHVVCLILLVSKLLNCKKVSIFYRRNCLILLVSKLTKLQKC